MLQPTSRFNLYCPAIVSMQLINKWILSFPMISRCLYCVCDTDSVFVNDALDQEHHRVCSVTDGLHCLLMTGVTQIHSSHLSHTHTNTNLELMKSLLDYISRCVALSKTRQKTPPCLPRQVGLHNSIYNTTVKMHELILLNHLYHITKVRHQAENCKLCSVWLLPV